VPNMVVLTHSHPLHLGFNGFSVRTIIAFAYYLDVKIGDNNVIKKTNLLTIVASYSQRKKEYF